MRVLLIEDDDLITEVICEGLESERYRVTVASDGEEGLRRACEDEYDLILLDLMLPGISGIEICRQLRARRDNTPILMLTARDTLDDRVKGLDMGADDYLPKPFEFPELLARVRALVRRDKVHRARVIRVHDLELDTVSRKVTRAGQEITLTPREYTLLEALVSKEGVSLTRDYIQQRVWMDDDSFSNTVDVCIGQVRKKVDAPFETKLIFTVHRLGYMIKSPDERDIMSN